MSKDVIPNAAALAPPSPAAPRVEPRRPQVGDAVEVAMTKTGPLIARNQTVLYWAPWTVTARDENRRMFVADDEDFGDDEEGKAWRWPATQGAHCRACRQPLLDEDTMVADGCPCNSPRGVNHGLVPARVCTCSTCDPAETGSARPRGAQGTAKDPDAPYVCLGCRTHYDTCPDFDAYNCPACGEKVCPVNRPAAKAMLAASQGAAVAGPAPVTTGRPMLWSLAEFRARLAVVFAEAEARPLPDTGLRAVLCEADRLADEYTEFLAAPPLPPASETPLTADQESARVWSALRDAQAAKAALEVQLRDEASAAMDMIQDWSGKWCDMRDERDALAAQLAGVGRLLESIEVHAERNLGASTAEKDRALDWICGQAKGARAALAASGPGETQGMSDERVQLPAPFRARIHDFVALTTSNEHEANDLSLLMFSLALDALNAGRAEAAAERTAAILDMLDALASAEGDPCCASTLRRAHDFVSDAFPKPGSAP